MSMRVVNEALDHSRSKATDRNVLVALADAAHHDGVTWLPIGKSERDEKRTVCRRASCSKREAIRAIQKLQLLGELQVVKVRRKSSTINVYRVIVGAIADVDVEYERLPFELPYRFGEGANLAPSTEADDGSVHGANLAPSNREAEGDSEAEFTVPAEPVEGDRSGAFTVPDPSRSQLTGPLDPSEGPSAADPSVETQSRERGNPAAAERSVGLDELTAIVRALPGADVDSPRQIRQLAIDLPRSVFFAALATVRERQPENACGLLTHLLKIARSERAAIASAKLAAELGQNKPVYVPAPWLIDSLKRHNPERYVRIVAKTMDPDLVREALASHRDVDDYVELARDVRAGREPGEQLGTPEQERERWLRENPGHPDAHHVVDGWHDVTDDEREALHQLADELRERAADSGDKAA